MGAIAHSGHWSSVIGSAGLNPPYSSSQRGVESWGQTHSVYNNLGECDTACIAYEGGVSANFEALPESDQGWGATVLAYAGLLVEGMSCWRVSSLELARMRSPVPV